jgi:peroxiredoxin
MVETLLLLGCALVPGQAPDRVPLVQPVLPAEEGKRTVTADSPRNPGGRDTGDWLLAPHLLRSQELVYRGSFIEDSDSAGIHFSRSYRLDLRLFVLEATPKGPEVAFLTTWRVRDAHAAQPAHEVDTPPNAVRLEVAQVDPVGKVVPRAGVRLQVPLDAMPTAECGVFVETPDHKMSVNDIWEIGEDGRPPTVWRVIGMEQVNGTNSVKLLGVQQSTDWDKPRADRTSWRRTDTVWMSTRIGVAVRVERVIERREPARQEVTQKSTLRYDLESSMQFPGNLADDRRQEIARARSFAESAAPLLATPTKVAPQLTSLLNKITFALDNSPPTPYRDAVLQVRKRVEAAKRGEVVAAVPEDAVVRPQVANQGELAPDFVAPDIVTHESARLQHWRGKSVLLVFYHPASVNANDLLRFSQRLATSYPSSLTVVGLSVINETDQVLKQRADLGLTFPLLKGNGLRVSYALEATPILVLIDPNGVVRASWTGWGTEIPDEVIQELRHWLPSERDRRVILPTTPAVPVHEVPPSR